jgi:hypothetical protein
VKRDLPLLRMSLQASYLLRLAEITDDDDTRHRLWKQVMMIRMTMNHVEPNY